MLHARKGVGAKKPRILSLLARGVGREPFFAASAGLDFILPARSTRGVKGLAQTCIQTDNTFSPTNFLRAKKQQ